MIKKLLVASLAFSAASTASAASVDGSVKFSVDVPEMIVLYHWDQAKLKFTDLQSKAVAVTDPHTLTQTTLTDSTINQNPVTETNATNPLANTINVTLQKSWGVRSITTNDPKLTLTTPDTKLLANAGDTDSIVIGDTVLNCTTAADCTSQGSATTPVTKGWALKTGDIKFTLDLANISQSGTYSTGGNNGNTFTLNFASQ